MNGLEVLRKLKADPATSQIPVIVLTNVSEMRISEDAISQGANMYLIKSDTEPDAAVDMVRDMLSKYGSDTTTDSSAATPTPTA
jgi:CheY-like chemotaxis protein